MSDPATITPVTSTKGILALAIVFTYAGMWAFAIYKVLMTNSLEFEPTQFLMEFAGATGVMGVIVIIVVQNFFRKTEAQ